MAVGYDLYSTDQTTQIDPYESIRKRYAAQKSLISKQQRQSQSEADESLKRRLAAQGMLGSGVYNQQNLQQRKEIQEKANEAMVGLGSSEEQDILSQQNYEKTAAEAKRINDLQYAESQRQFNEQSRQWGEQMAYNEKVRIDTLNQSARDFAADMLMNKLNYATALKQAGAANMDTARYIADAIFKEFQVELSKSGLYTIPADQAAAASTPSFAQITASQGQTTIVDVMRPSKGRIVNGKYTLS